MNGIISGSESGSISADATSVSAVTQWGLVLMSIGFLGALWFFLRTGREKAGPGYA